MLPDLLNYHFLKDCLSIIKLSLLGEQTAEFMSFYVLFRYTFSPSFCFCFSVELLVKLLKAELFLLLSLPEIGLRSIILIDTVVDLKRITWLDFNPDHVGFLIGYPCQSEVIFVV